MIFEQLHQRLVKRSCVIGDPYKILQGHSRIKVLS